jgi:hypothetical protein
VLTSIRPVLTILVLGSAVALVACAEDKKATAGGGPAGAAKTVAEIGRTRTALDRSLEAFKAGDKARAQELVKMKQGAPVAEVEVLVGQAKADLATAEQKLK